MFWCIVSLYIFSRCFYTSSTQVVKKMGDIKHQTAYKMYINNAVFYIYIVRVTVATCNGGFNLILR